MASYTTWSAPRRAFMYWHRSTMARPSKMAILSPKHKWDSAKPGAGLRVEHRVAQQP
jgi:hypothetical protein